RTRTGSDQGACAATRDCAQGSTQAAAAADQEGVALLMLVAGPVRTCGGEPVLVAVQIKRIERHADARPALQASGGVGGGYVTGKASSRRDHRAAADHNRLCESCMNHIARPIIPCVDCLIDPDVY